MPRPGGWGSGAESRRNAVQLGKLASIPCAGATMALQHVDAVAPDARALATAWPQGIVTHLALDAAGIAAIAAGDNAFLKDLVENRVMKCSPLLRGE